MTEILLANFDWIKICVHFNDNRSLIHFRKDFENVYQVSYYDQIQLLNRNWTVKPHHFRKGLTELISEEGFLLELNTNKNLGNDYPLIINLKKPERKDLPCLLWENPIPVMKSFLDELSFHYGNLTYSINRVDLACHFQGYQPKVIDIERFGGNLPLGPYKPGKVFTGFVIGNKKAKNKRIEGTLYNIEERIKDIPGSYVPYTYYDPTVFSSDEPVWNLELKIFKKMMIEYGINSLEDLTDLSAIWEYLTIKRLKLLIPSKDSNQRRWKTDPHWKVIQSAFGKSIFPIQKKHFVAKKLTPIHKVKKIESSLLSFLADADYWELPAEKKIEAVLGLLDLNRFTNSSLINFISERRR